LSFLFSPYRMIVFPPIRPPTALFPIPGWPSKLRSSSVDGPTTFYSLKLTFWLTSRGALMSVPDLLSLHNEHSLFDLVLCFSLSRPQERLIFNNPAGITLVTPFTFPS